MVEIFSLFTTKKRHSMSGAVKICFAKIKLLKVNKLYIED